MFKLGKKPARDSVKLKFGTYFDASLFPTPPVTFGIPWAISNWGLLANDQTGDCVWAGSAHETMIWNQEAAETVIFTDQNVLSDYSAATGYNPADSSTDQGSDMHDAAAYRKKTGIVDAAGKRHTIDAYVALTPRDLDQLALATYLMGAVGIGLQLPQSAEQQFNQAEPWDVVPDAPLAGGHYVPCVGRNSHGNFVVVTWGRLQAVTPAFLSAYMDEGLAYLSFERLKNSVSLQGFDQATLESDLTKLQGVSPMAAPQGTALDPDEVTVAGAAVKTFISANVPSWAASYISADEETQLATAVVTAIENWRNAKEI